MKRVLIAFVALLLLAIGAVALSIDWIASEAIQRNATRALGVETNVGFVRLSPLAGQVEVSSLEIANPPGFGSDPFLAFDSFELKADLASLRRDVVDVPLFRLEGVELSLERVGDKTNTDAILANLKRFEKQGSAGKEPVPEKKGPEKRYRVSKLVIRDVAAHVEWSSFASKQSALDVKIEGIELNNPGGKRGLTLAELSNVVVKAVLDSVRRSGQLPAEVARDLAGGLSGLARLPISVTGGVLEGAGALLPGPAGDVLDAAGGAVRDAGDLLGRGIDGVLGKEEEKR